METIAKSKEYKPKQSKYNFRVYLGTTKGDFPEQIYLSGFSWDCGWYWGGGYLGNRNMHTHFDGCFLNVVDVRGHSLGNFVSCWYKGNFPETAKEISNGCSIWESLSFFLDNAQFTEKEWWRIKDLYKQFYSLKQCAKTFHSGGHCTAEGRNKKEVNQTMENKINKHIEEVIILEIIKAVVKTK